MLLRSIAAAAALFALPFGASAATITFDSADACSSHGISIQGAYGAACEITTFYDGQGGTQALLERGASSSFWVATFDYLADWVSIDLGDYGFDADHIFLTAYDVNGAETTSEYTIGKGVFGLHTLSVEASDITSVKFGSKGGFGGVFADNLTVYPQVSAVPVPASVLLLGSAFAGLGFMRRSKRT